MAEDWKKQNHSKNLSVLLYVAHVLPQSCKSERITRYIFLPEDRTESWEYPQNFHANFTLNRWNDHIIQPARNTVLDYYRVRTLFLINEVLAITLIQSNSIHPQRYAEPSDIEEYMHINNLS